MRKKILLSFMICGIAMISAIGCSSKGGGGGGGGDTTAPSVPTSLTSAVISASQISIAWGASTDDVGVTGYKIYRDGTYLKSATTTTALDSGLTSSTQYCYQVAAYDAAGNESNKSLQTCATATAVATFKMSGTGQTASFTNTFGENHDYTFNPPSYTDNGNGTIKDNVTGRTWQKQDDGATRTWADATVYCSGLSLGGQTGWRLPTIMELVSIADYGSSSSTFINTTYFPVTTHQQYWSSDTYFMNNSSSAWGIYYGRSEWLLKTGNYYSRCVLGGDSVVLSFTDNGNDTVTDNTTHLMWTKKDSDLMNWEDAIAYCEGNVLAGFNDWRLPNIKEFATLSININGTDRSGPPLSTMGGDDWSSTTNTLYPDHAWTFNIPNGTIDQGYDKSRADYHCHTRCVRGTI